MSPMLGVLSQKCTTNGVSSRSQLFLGRNARRCMGLYTKNGRPLQVSGDTVYMGSGTAIGRIRGNKLYGTDGRYVGTITGDLRVYRSSDSAGVGSPFST